MIFSSFSFREVNAATMPCSLSRSAKTGAAQQIPLSYLQTGQTPMSLYYSDLTENVIWRRKRGIIRKTLSISKRDTGSQ